MTVGKGENAMRAFVLIQVRTGEIRQVVRQLARVDGVVEATMTFGPYDAVAVVEAPDVAGIGRVMAAGIQPIPGVTETLTCLAVEA
ncbi:MAG TPA: Lrp/AsnC ligand binding domain-containing protein [Anaerolineales bacterium]|nr:Lrp/AsnC ligand binding domain-containing protein [Anaerolineales bacterium]